MNKLIFIPLSLILCLCSMQAQTTQQEYMMKEWNDYFKGVYQLPQNNYKATEIYNQLVRYSGMTFYIRYAQTFQWGQAHNGGIILLDYSSLAKPKEILAFIMAHEWGHEALGHSANIYKPSGNIWQYNKGPTADEDAADYYSGQFLASNGYNVNIVTDFLRNLPPNSMYDTHSSGRQRAENVLSGYNSVRGGSSRPGRAYAICSDCNGSGSVISENICNFCRGSRFIPCRGCGGNGGAYAYGYNVYHVYGYWWFPCRACGGNKGVMCNRCNGLGKTRVEMRCSRCRGTGKTR